MTGTVGVFVVGGAIAIVDWIKDVSNSTVVSFGKSVVALGISIKEEKWLWRAICELGRSNCGSALELPQASY